jgi:signal transduction histidine kinase/CheY-like chemotaxis protein
MSTVPLATALEWALGVATVVLVAAVVGGIFLVGRLLRERRRGYEDVARTATLNRAVLDSTEDGIRLIDLEGRTLLANPTIEQLTTEVFGFAPDSTLPERGRLAPRLRDAAEFLRTNDRIAADPECVTIDEWELAESGRAFRRYTAPVRGPDAVRLGRIIVVREITSEREAERVKEELIATVSHELRTPLTGILGFSEILQRQTLDEASRLRFLGIVHAEAKRLTRLVDDFLDLQRIESGAMTVALERVRLGDVVRDEVARAAERGSGHELETELEEDLPEVIGEPDALARVLANLLSNAIKYSPEGGTIRVVASRRGEVVRVSVTDSGLGIPADQQRRLFTKFFRVDSSETRKIGGTGLGLALIRQIVEAHGGRVGVESAAGVGSTFWFELPWAASAEGARPRVLVVEDDPTAVELFRTVLVEDGYEVEFAADGGAALARAAELAPDVVCLDIALEGDLDGWDTLARLKDGPTTARVPVVICTAGNGRGRAAALGAADLLMKPFESGDLLRAIRRVLPERGSSLLVVDDDGAIRRLVVGTLAGQGLEVREAADGRQALDRIAERRPDAIVLDLVMPGLDGFGVLTELRGSEDTREIPVIVLTGRRLSPEDQSFLRERTASVLLKNEYSAQELRRLVRSALGTRAEAAAA